MGDLFIHTGLNRCFTQFLRAHVFPNLPKTIKYIRDDDPLSIIIHKLIRQEIKLTNDNRELVKDLTKKRMVGDCDLLLAASHGSFASVSWNTLHHKEEFLIKTKILKDILPNSKILFIIKEQIDFIISHWKCAFQQRNIMDISDFVVTKDEALSFSKFKKTKFANAPYLDHRPWLYPYGLDFDNYVQKYYEYFGEENCCVIHFNELKNNRAIGLSKILKFFTGSSDSSLVKKMIYSSENSDTLSMNRTASHGGLNLMRLADRIIKFFNIELPYGEPYYKLKSKDSILQKIFNRINWLTIRAAFQSRNFFIVKIADLFSKNSNYKNRIELLAKFPDLA